MPDRESIESAQVEEEWRPGDLLLETCEVRSVLGESSLGRVYRLHHRKWKIDLAVRTFNKALWKEAENRNKIIKECKNLAALGLHPNVADCHYVRDLAGMGPCIFSELVEGESLKALLERRKESAHEELFDIAFQCIDGLDYAHRRGITHGNVKPSNFLVTPQGDLKILDFCIAGALMGASNPDSGTKLSDPTRTMILEGGQVGAPAYMPAEQWGFGEIGPWSDIYSFGIMLYELFCGRRPFESEDIAMLKTAHIDSEPPDPDMIREDLPSSLSACILRCLGKKREERFESCAELRESLATAFSEVTGGEYYRAQPDETLFEAEGLSNRGISLIDCAMSEQGVESLEIAHRKKIYHPLIAYNYHLALWQSGRITDIEMIRNMEEIRQAKTHDSLARFLIGLVHRRRGDIPGCITEMEEAKKSGALDPEISEQASRIIEEARNSERAKEGCVRVLDRGIEKKGAFFWETLMRGLKNPEGYQDEVTSMSLASDDNLLLTGSRDKTVKLWNLAKGKCLIVFKWHSVSVLAVSISTNGHLGASADASGCIRFWDLLRMKHLKRVMAPLRHLTSLCITPDGKEILVSGNDRISLLDLSTGRVIRFFSGHEGEVRSVTISPDGKSGLSGSADRTLRLWDLASGEILRVFEGHESDVTSVSILPPGDLCLSGSADMTMRLWDLRNGETLRILRGHESGITSVHVSRDGRYGLSGSADKTLRLWRLDSGECVRTFEGHGDCVNSVCISHHGRKAISAGADKSLRYWDISPGEPLHFFFLRAKSSRERRTQVSQFEDLIEKAASLLQSGSWRDASRLLDKARDIQGYEYSTIALDLKQDAIRHGIRRSLKGAWLVRIFEGHNDEVTSVCVSPGGTQGLSGSLDGTLCLWDFSSGMLLRTLSGHSYSVESVSISADGKLALSGSWDSTMRVWDLSTGVCRNVIDCELYFTGCADISYCGRFGLTGELKSVVLYDLSTGRSIKGFGSFIRDVKSVSFSPDGRFALSGSRDKTVRYWDLSDGKCIATLYGHGDEVASVCISSDGNYALSGSFDRGVRYWDLSRREHLRVMERHGDIVRAVCMTSCGRFGASGSDDSMIVIWDLESGSPLFSLSGHHGPVYSLSLSPDGRYLLSGSGDRTLRLWELDWEYEFPDKLIWDEGIRPYLKIFLLRHRPINPGDYSFEGQPSWNEEDFQQFLGELSYRGYGWISPDRIRSELEIMKGGL